MATYLARSDLNTEIDRAINRAIAYYAQKRFWFNETTGTLSTVASQQSYSTSDGLPSDISEIDVVSLTTDSSNTYTLNPRTFQYIKDVNTSGTSNTGHPADWSWYASKLWFYPTPDAVYTVTISYKKDYPTALSADSDTNDFTDNAQDLIEQRAAWWVSAVMIRDFDSARAFKETEMDEYRRHQRKTDQLTTTGRIRPTQF